jgi:hypothetical protein
MVIDKCFVGLVMQKTFFHSSNTCGKRILADAIDFLRREAQAGGGL